ncbi:MAG: efflux RND transporter permease subunit [Candidatus Bruticola sp.]
MSIWDFCIKRPVFTTVLVLSLIMVGIMGYTRMGVDLMPDFDIPVVNVTTTYVGADPEVIDQDVTNIIEEQVGTIEGIKSIKSVSYEGYSSIVIEFELDRDIDVATQEVRDKVSKAEQDLPTAIDPPLVQKIDPDSSPILYLSLSGDIPYQRLSQLADDVLQDQIQNISGVGSVDLYGFRERNVRIWLDAAKMEKYSISPAEVLSALGAWHVELPGGRLETDKRESTIKMQGEYTDIEELKTMTLSWRNGSPVRLKDVARVEDGEEDIRNYSRENGKPCVTLAVIKQTGSNTVGIAQAVRNMLPELRKLLPPSVTLDVAYDTSTFIKDAVQGVGDDLLLGGFFTAIVIYLFLRHVKMTIISLISIPTSLLGAFGFMYFMDFTINQITMLAMSLAVGLVIDDTIVVLENIFRMMEEGSEDGAAAASKGTREVAFAVLAATMTIAAIFLPVAFMGGIIGRVFYQFGISVGIAITLSYCVSITLTPMLCGRWLKPEKHDNVFTNAVGAFLSWMDRTYRSCLTVVLSNRFTRVVTILVALGCFAFGLFLSRFVGEEFAPNADRGSFIVKIKTPIGTSLALTDERCQALTKVIKTYPEVTKTMEMIGDTRTGQVNEAQIIVELKPRRERQKTQQQIMDEMRVEFEKMAGVTAIPSHIPTMGGGSTQYDLQYALQGANLDTLEEITGKITRLLQTNKGICDIDDDLELIQPQISVYPKRDSAADVGLTTNDITTALQTMMAGFDAAKFKIGSKRYDIRVKAEDNFREDVESVRKILLRTPSGKNVYMRSVADVVEGLGPNCISRYDRMRSVTITANAVSGVLTSGQAADWFESEVGKLLESYPGYKITAGGMTKNQRESMQYMMFALMSSIVIVYLVLAAQFESFIHPFTIMMTLPLALFGVFAALFICHENLSIFALIGIIMLVGIVTRNGILLVEFANQLREEEGLDPHYAMLKAGPLRLRPILMTAVSSMIGVLPVALGLSEGGEMRSAMGVAVIGGLITSTFLTLFVVPTAYITFDGTLARITAIMRRLGFKFAEVSDNASNTASSVTSGSKSGISLSKPELPKSGKSSEDIRRGKVIDDSDDKEVR